MTEVITSIIELHKDFIAVLPPTLGEFFNLLFLVLLVAVYAIFIWKFYRFIATKNIIELNLNKYNRTENPLLSKILAAALYFIEYILIMPFLIFFWFATFTFFLILLTESLDIKALLIVSTTIVAAIRMTSYYKENLAKDLAKLIPFTLLAIALFNPNFFSIERILNHFNEIPQFLGNIIIYLLFIIFLEIILRFFDFIFSLFGLNIEEEVEEKSAKEK